MIGTTILSGALLGAAANGRTRRPIGARSRAGLMLLLMVPILVETPQLIMQSIGHARRAERTRASWAAMVGDVGRVKGPVYCEVLAACFWAGKPMGIDFFAYGQRLRTGTDPRPMMRAVAGQVPEILILDRDFYAHGSEQRLPDPLPVLMRANYRVVRSIGGTDELMRR